jgi:hypothetical protein
VSWRVVVRAGSRVERDTLDSLPAALDVLEERTRAAAAGPEARAIDLRARRWAPEDQIAARAEVAGPQRWRPDVRAGIDVRGDGSVQAWTGAPERRALEPASGEDAYAALRRALATRAGTDRGIAADASP